MSTEIKPWRSTPEASRISASWDAVALADREIRELRAALAEAQVAGCADSYALQSAIAAQAPSAPVVADAALWLEAEESARNADPRDVIGKHAMLYSTRFSITEPDGNNPRWPLYFSAPTPPTTGEA